MFVFLSFPKSLNRRCLLYLCIHLSLYGCFYPFLFICQSVYLCTPVCLSVSVYIFSFVFLSVCLSLSLYDCCMSFPLYTFLYVPDFVSLSNYPISLSMSVLVAFLLSNPHSGYHLLQDLSLRAMGPYSQHFIFCVTYEQPSKLECLFLGYLSNPVQYLKVRPQLTWLGMLHSRVGSWPYPIKLN